MIPILILMMPAFVDIHRSVISKLMSNDVMNNRRHHHHLHLNLVNHVSILHINYSLHLLLFLVWLLILSNSLKFNLLFLLHYCHFLP